MMIFEICAIIATVVFVVLAVYIIITLKKLETSLDQTSVLLRKSDCLVESVNERIERFGPLLDSVSDVGCTLNAVTSSFKTKQTSEQEKKVQTVVNLIDLALLGVTVWNDLKRR